ncbi:MAG: isochorismatase family protein [Sphingomonadaceae bacterium]|uniref:isochorismatase family protein n=1 Tax=Thermaurantiacus sp. TaxID=2820283 RepID=UPI00298EF034|nr:isochorismatase family protein [Thermaurantiacus sp.]MCS6987555.1 isochorismatase family protein [Sphingomonadaceae bacterium]MDW8415156.1 isochorismatase family protein [Thermaurantiacus sp.]
MRRPDIRADYAAAGFGRALPWGRRPALLLVDFAAAYFVPDSPLYAGVEAARAAAARLRAACRAAGIPRLFTRVEYVPGDPARSGGLFYRKVAALSCFNAGNPLGDFTPELAPDADEPVIVKQYPSAFFRTDLAQRLEDLGVDTLLITGLSTSGCVRASAVDALCHGFVPVVVRDAVGDRDERVHEANLFDLEAKTADVADLARVLAYVEGIAAERTAAAKT